MGARPAGDAAPLPEAAAEPPRDGSTGAPPADLAEAWSRLLDQGKGVPRGLGLLLRAGRLLPGEGGRLTLVLPPGPAVERLREGIERRRLEEALAGVLHRPAALDVVAEGEASAETAQAAAGEERPGRPLRITQDKVREDRLKELVQREPLLQRAVDELDLELLE
ncbi:MAG: hypothetical protein D6701_02100 [Gemmatimonadetes bacterium]|nr:MAG: hypothetical protein D6701_02100 [Gemmatimonadota bacterium]